MQVCPISRHRIDERAARASAGIIVAAVATSTALSAAWLALLVAVDFLIRSTGRGTYSPTGLFARRLLAALGVAPAPTDAAPKIFAARIGLALSAAMAGSMLSGASIPAAIAGGVLSACAFLEAAFGACLGCWIYGLSFPSHPRPSADTARSSMKRR